MSGIDLARLTALRHRKGILCRVGAEGEATPVVEGVSYVV